METPITFLGNEFGNRLYVKREELYPVALGGNKARIAKPFFDEIDAGGYDSVVTYGSAGSNLCRVVAAMAAMQGLKCVAVMHGEDNDISLNLRLVRASGASTVFCPVGEVADTIEAVTEELRRKGRRPFFIPGGGYGAIGAQAYVDCFDEIDAYERRSGVAFDHIFLPSGTGTTQAGLVCGKLLRNATCEIVGISIARERSRGESAVLECVRAYLAAKGIAVPDGRMEKAVVFEDAYTGGGYGCGDYAATTAYVYRKYALPLDNTYTGKAFYGMGQYLKERRTVERNVLFINTGGVPSFFEDLIRGNNRSEGITAG
ncbi:MAG: pyridoxal-phosphate dependent enzyme [Clostridia bacterium]|nr:pyridoxal-phosphate dependent enzyme [Clostridia bacterium]